MILASTKDFRLAAQRRLPRFLFEYIDGGAYDESTLRKNVSDLTEIALRQRVLRDVSQVDLSTTLFGRKMTMPVALGPIGIVVSNHGGRQLDGVLSSARALPAIADAVHGKLTILADSGVRSGLDVVRLLALGAQGVLLGRAWAFALAANGGAGVSQLLEIFAREMRVAMALTSVCKIGEIDRSILA